MEEYKILIIFVTIFIVLVLLAKYIFKRISITVAHPDEEKETRKKANRNKVSQRNVSQRDVSQGVGYDVYKDFITNYQFRLLEGEVSKLRNDIFSLKQTIRNLEETVKGNTKSRMGDQGTGYTQMHDPYKEQVKSRREENVFYMSGPVGNGFQNNFKQVRIEHGMTMYRFEENSSTTAYFSFHGDEISIKDALSMANKYVEPVCDALNKVTASSKKILTVEKGFVILKGDFWEVQKKAKISYE